MNLLDTASLVVTPNAYKTSKLYSIVPTTGTGDMTFTRSGDTATRVNSAGLIESVLANRPRLDYLGSTCPKLLIEPQRTNQALNSEDFSTATWTTNASNVSVTTNVINSPLGTQTADKIIATNATSTNQFVQHRALSVNGTIYSCSVFVKKGEWNTIRLQMVNFWTPTPTAIFNVDTLAITGLSSATAKIEDYGNGWFRCSITATNNSASGGNGYMQIQIGNNGSITQTGNGTNGLHLWGAQFENGSFSTSYIPTTTATVTRNADQCYDDTATALIGQTEGTIFIDFDLTNVTDEFTRNIISLGLFGANYTDRVNIAQTALASGLKYRIGYRANNVQVIDDLTLSYTSGRIKMALIYNATSMNLYINGSLVRSYTFASSPFTTSMTTVYLGNYPNINTSNGHRIYSAILWKTRLTSQELITLTTL
jgi:hypothetical protein